MKFMIDTTYNRATALEKLLLFFTSSQFSVDFETDGLMTVIKYKRLGNKTFVLETRRALVFALGGKEKMKSETVRRLQEQETLEAELLHKLAKSNDPDEVLTLKIKLEECREAVKGLKFIRGYQQ